MEYYLGATVVSILMAEIIKKIFGFDKHKTLKMFISILPLTIVSAIRYNVGWDYPHYTEAYINYIEYGDLYFSEIGFKSIVRVIALFTENYVALFVVFSILISFFFSKCFEHYGGEKHVLQYIALFFLTRYFFCSLNIMRQALAMVMVIYAFRFLIFGKPGKKKYLKFILVTLLASSIHIFAIVFIPISFVVTMDIKKIIGNVKTFSLLVITIVAIFIFMFSSGYLAYFDTMFGNDGTIAISELLISLSILMFASLNYKKLIATRQNILFYNLELIAFVVCLASIFLPTADRIIWYFATVPNIFLIPAIIDTYGKKIAIIPFCTMYLGLSIVVFNQAVLTDSYDIIPYNNVIDAGVLEGMR